MENVNKYNVIFTLEDMSIQIRYPKQKFIITSLYFPEGFSNAYSYLIFIIYLF